MYVHDGTGLWYFSPQRFPQELAQGQKVEITGRTTLTDGGLGFADLKLTVQGQQDLPPAKRLKLSELGSDFGQWVEISGRVRRADTDRGRLGLTLHDQGYSCLVYVMGPSGRYDGKRLLDCEVRLRGINASKVVGGRLESATLFASGTNELVVVGKPAEPSSLPVVSIDTLLNRDLGDWTNRMIHLNGLISAYKPGESVVIRDPTGTIRAQIVQLTRAQVDERIDLWGFLNVSSAQALLTDAFFESVHPATPASPTPPTQASATPATNPPAMLSSISNIMRLPREMLAQKIPVSLRGVITYADPEFHNGFLQQGDDAIYLDLQQAEVRPGFWVEVKGVTDRGGFAPQINEVHVQTLEQTNLPTPVKVTLEDLADGSLDSHWVELQGIVRRTDIDWNHLQLTLTTREGKFKAVVPGVSNPIAPLALVGSQVRVLGACGSSLNSRGQLSGITLHVPNLEQIQILDPVPTDPFGVTATPVAAISKYSPGQAGGRRVKVSGIVTLVIPGSGFYLQENSGGIRVNTQTTNSLVVGDTVEVLGFPALGDFSPCLEETVVRQTGRQPLPSCVRTTSEAILLRGETDGQRVELEARLIQRAARSANPKLVLQDGPVIFTAHFADRPPDQHVRELEPGSTLRLTGVCAITGGEGHEPESFRLLLTDSADVELLQSPSWWSARHTLVALGGLTLIATAAFSWAAALRRQVRVHTETIRQKYEEGTALAESLAREKNLLTTLVDNLPDQVFVKDRSGRLLLSNRAYAQFRDLERIGTRDPAASRLASADQATDRTVLEAGTGVFDVETELRCNDGSARWFSTTKVPLKDSAGAVIGLVGISHEFTERKQAEQELLAMHKQLLVSSHQAGMAEVASSVLHNVGNVLNSVNVSATLIHERTKESRIQKLSRITELLSRHENDLVAFLTRDVKGRQTLGYLSQLAEHLEAERLEILSETQALTKYVDHIKEIVAMQQSYARVGGTVEPLQVTELVEDALRMNLGALERHKIEMVREFPKQPPPLVPVDRHKVLQILVNLIRNAKYACEESGRPDKRIIVRVVSLGESLKVAVADNGVGILPENRTRIFQHGFTTRKDGHGFGLHNAALAATDLGGGLSVESEGIGKGATFVLDLPIRPRSDSAGV